MKLKGQCRTVMYLCLLNVLHQYNPTVAKTHALHGGQPNVAMDQLNLEVSALPQAGPATLMIIVGEKPHKHHQTRSVRHC